MKKRVISLALALVLALSLAGCGEKTTEDTTPTGVAVQVQTVASQDISTENTVSGQVTAGSETSVYVTATAKCTAVYVEAGDAVKAGRVAGQQGIADVQGRVQTNVGLQSSHSRSLAFWFADPVTA